MSKAKTKTKTKKKVSNKSIDFRTGLTHQQLKAAQLLADGWSTQRVADTVCCTAHTVRSWRKKIPAFARVVDEYSPPEKFPVTTLPMQDMRPEGIDERLIQLVNPAVEGLAYLLANPNTNDMARLGASKFVLSTLYKRLVEDSEVAPQAIAELREALMVIK